MVAFIKSSEMDIRETCLTKQFFRFYKIKITYRNLERVFCDFNFLIKSWESTFTNPCYYLCCLWMPPGGKVLPLPNSNKGWCWPISGGLSRPRTRVHCFQRRTHRLGKQSWNKSGMPRMSYAGKVYLSVLTQCFWLLVKIIDNYLNKKRSIKTNVDCVILCNIFISF